MQLNNLPLVSAFSLPMSYNFRKKANLLSLAMDSLNVSLDFLEFIAKKAIENVSFCEDDCITIEKFKNEISFYLDQLPSIITVFNPILINDVLLRKDIIDTLMYTKSILEHALKEGNLTHTSITPLMLKIRKALNLHANITEYYKRTAKVSINIFNYGILLFLMYVTTKIGSLPSSLKLENISNILFKILTLVMLYLMIHTTISAFPNLKFPRWFKSIFNA